MSVVLWLFSFAQEFVIVGAYRVDSAIRHVPALNSDKAMPKRPSPAELPIDGRLIPER